MLVNIIEEGHRYVKILKFSISGFFVTRNSNYYNKFYLQKSHFKIGCCCLLWLIGSCLYGQTTANPFDLLNRQPIETTAPIDSSTQAVTSTRTAEKPDNPFDLAVKPLSLIHI